MISPIVGKRVFVAGHRGMVGSAICRRLEGLDCEILTVDRNDLDLINQDATMRWLKDNRPDIVIVAAAKVGGILANQSYPADFLYQNLMISANLIDAAHRADVDRLLYLGSSCIYPKLAQQPIGEDELLTGSLESTNEWYAIAKIAGIKMCESYRIQYKRNYISAMPTNLYGPFDNFDLDSSHVLPALIRKVHEAKLNGDASVTIWGTGTPRREFLHADDCADACLFLLEHYSDRRHCNVGSGTDLTIRDLAEMIIGIVGFNGTIEFDLSKPDGTPRKLMSNQRISQIGWTPKIGLEEGIMSTYRWFLDNYK